VTLKYSAPDVLPNGATFERTVTLPPDVRYFTVDERVAFPGAPPDSKQRAVSITSFGAGQRGAAAVALAPASGTGPGQSVGLYFPGTLRLAVIAWRNGDIEGTTGHTTGPTDVRLVLAQGKTAHLLFASVPAATEAAVTEELHRLEAIAQGPQPTPANSPH
jgi:hypothetical protein